jgi:hypothetical protein
MKLGLIFCLFASQTLSLAQNSLSTDELAAGWTLLFDGTSIAGWVSERGGNWLVNNGTIEASTGEYGWLRYDAKHSDFVLKLDFRSDSDGNSGVYLRADQFGLPHLTGYEVQIFDGHPTHRTGSLLGCAKAQGGVIKPGHWQTLEVVARGDVFIVQLDGAIVLKARDGKSRTGYIGLQYNKGKKIAFRNIKLRPLTSERAAPQAATAAAAAALP